MSWAVCTWFSVCPRQLPSSSGLYPRAGFPYAACCTGPAVPGPQPARLNHAFTSADLPVSSNATASGSETVNKLHRKKEI